MLAWMSCPAARAALILAIAGMVFDQLRWPPALRWKISTGTPASRPIRIASSIASSQVSASDRMWVM